jgi:hypothetical protein
VLTIAHKAWKITELSSPKKIAKMPEAKMVYCFPQPDASFFGADKGFHLIAWSRHQELVRVYRHLATVFPLLLAK